jgi:hypothetical protein
VKFAKPSDSSLAEIFWSSSGGGRKKNTLLDDLINRRKYWELKEEAEDHVVCRSYLSHFFYQVENVLPTYL